MATSDPSEESKECDICAARETDVEMPCCLNKRVCKTCFEALEDTARCPFCRQPVNVRFSVNTAWAWAGCCPCSNPDGWERCVRALVFTGALLGSQATACIAFFGVHLYGNNSSGGPNGMRMADCLVAGIGSLSVAGSGFTVVCGDVFDQRPNQPCTAAQATFTVVAAASLAFDAAFLVCMLVSPRLETPWVYVFSFCAVCGYVLSFFTLALFTYILPQFVRKLRERFGTCCLATCCPCLEVVTHRDFAEVTAVEP